MLLVLAILSFLFSALALPTFDDFGHHKSLSVNSRLVPHTSTVMVLATQQRNKHHNVNNNDEIVVPYGLVLHDPGNLCTLLPNTGQVRSDDSLLANIEDLPGNLTALPSTSNAFNPPSFHIFKNRLWVYRNDSAIWPVNFINATQMRGYPLQMVVGTKQFGVKQGIWSWRDNQLHYDHGVGKQDFYLCPTSNSLRVIFMYTAQGTIPMPTGKDGSLTHYNRFVPADCDAITFSQRCR